MAGETQSQRLMSALNTMGTLPKDPYQHGMQILETKREKLEKLSQLVSNEIKLANVGDDKLLALYQIDGLILTNIFGMALDDEEDMRAFFETQVTAWFIELAFTRAKGGKEREQQANLGRGYFPGERVPGATLPYQEPRNQNPLSGLFGGKKQPPPEG